MKMKEKFVFLAIGFGKFQALLKDDLDRLCLFYQNVGSDVEINLI